MLKGKNIVLGITGSIAAYKAAVLLRLLVKNGANVRVLMTPLAKEFVAPLTFSTLSKHPVLTEFYNPVNGDWNSHVDLGLWADLLLIAPATANTIAKMANGLADNLLLTTYLSARCKVMVAPAMDLDMFMHPSTQKNIETLKSYGNLILEPSTGELASGLSGKGRMEEPEIICQQVEAVFQGQKLAGKTVIVTAGPTFEPIDPVRFIGNRSSGKMGYALAQALADQGAEVILISGPVNENIEHGLVKKVDVATAKEMLDACMAYFGKSHGAILCAAVADFTPLNPSAQKIKRKEGQTLQLKPTVDIAATLGQLKSKNQVLAGFALETDNGRDNALAKLKSKNLDFIVLNSLTDNGAGFQGDTNKVTIFDADGREYAYPLKSKRHVADDIVEKLSGYFL
jgi:phosphopantothenoylcysteine decarboxylase / phosphopantothenate---cysteine ligase